MCVESVFPLSYWYMSVIVSILFIVFIVFCYPVSIWFYRLSSYDSNWKINLTRVLHCVTHHPVALTYLYLKHRRALKLKVCIFNLQNKNRFFLHKVLKILSTYPINGFRSNIWQLINLGCFLLKILIAYSQRMFSFECWLSAVKLIFGGYQMYQN